MKGLSRPSQIRNERNATIEDMQRKQRETAHSYSQISASIGGCFDFLRATVCFDPGDVFLCYLRPELRPRSGHRRSLQPCLVSQRRYGRWQCSENPRVTSVSSPRHFPRVWVERSSGSRERRTVQAGLGCYSWHSTLAPAPRQKPRSETLYPGENA